MEGKRFDELARAVSAGSSRRRVIAGLLAGALSGLRMHMTAADDSGTAIADASGGHHNRATATDPANPGNDRGHDRDNADGDDERDDKEGNSEDKDGNREDKGDGGGPPDDGGALDAQCLCSSGTCCAQDQQCCDQFEGPGDETPIGSICCDADTSCACGDCVPFCDLDVPFAPCDCNCPANATVCTQLSPATEPFTCCDDATQTCCRVGTGADAVGTCCDDATETCTPGVGCSTI